MSDNVRVYRMEYSDGRGMYGYGPKGSMTEFRSAARIAFGPNCDLHPEPNDDPLLRHLFGAGEDQGYFYGFVDLFSLRQWIPFDEWLVILHELGIVLSVYVCPKNSVVLGEKQLMFCEHVSKTQHNILEYLRLNSACTN